MPKTRRQGGRVCVCACAKSRCVIKSLSWCNVNGVDSWTLPVTDRPPAALVRTRFLRRKGSIGMRRDKRFDQVARGQARSMPGDRSFGFSRQTVIVSSRLGVAKDRRLAGPSRVPDGAKPLQATRQSDLPQPSSKTSVHKHNTRTRPERRKETWLR